MGDIVVQMLALVGLLLFSLASASNKTGPSWQNLNCDGQGTKYLFSEQSVSWDFAREECGLYGGWLLSLDNLQEQNCLIRYAHSASLTGWFWHDANDIENNGVLVHAHTNEDLTWIHYLWNCGGGTTPDYGNGDALLI